MNECQKKWMCIWNEWKRSFLKKFVQLGVVVRVSIYFWMRYAPREIGSCYCDMMWFWVCAVCVDCIWHVYIILKKYTVQWNKKCVDFFSGGVSASLIMMINKKRNSRERNKETLVSLLMRIGSACASRRYWGNIIKTNCIKGAFFGLMMNLIEKMRKINLSLR